MARKKLPSSAVAVNVWSRCEPMDCDVDFVYRNFFYEHWIVWAPVARDDWCRERSRPNRWPRLVNAFSQGAIRIIEADPELRDDVAQLERCLLAARRCFFEVEVDSSRAELFGHQAA